MHNENRLDEMCKIMEGLQKYVPSKPIVSSIRFDSETVTQHDVVHKKLLLFGDQLTSARVRGAQAIRCSHETNDDKLLGVIPATSDGHARVVLLKVCISLHDHNIIIRI